MQIQKYDEHNIIKPVTEIMVIILHWIVSTGKFSHIILTENFGNSWVKELPADTLMFHNKLII